MVSVRTHLPESELQSAIIQADLEVEFAGQTAQYKQVPFQRIAQGNTVHLSGTIPAKMSDFKINPPSLFGIAVKNDMPIRVEMNWHPM